MKKLITLFLCLFMSISLFAQNVELSNSLMQQYQTGKNTAISKNATTHDHLWLTPILTQVAIHWSELTDEAKQLFKTYRSQPTLTGTELIAESGNFRFHYTLDGGAGESVNPTDVDANSIPDYVDNLISKFTAMYTLYHITTGLTVPPSDGTNGGNALYDIYISGDIAGDGTYGYVQAQDNIGDNPNSSTLTEVDAYSSFMVMRNNYAGFGDENIALSVTAAHEYMHATQNGYSVSMDSWFKEIGATWSEEFAFPGYDDNFQYLMDLFGKPDVAMNLGNGEVPELDNHWYSSWVFAKYLTEHTGNEIIKNIYERCIIQNAANAMDAELSANWSTNFDALFLQYTVANTLMTDNANYAPYTYIRAADYNTYIAGHGGFAFENLSSPMNYSGTPISWNSQSDGNNRLMRLSADYFLFTADRNFNIVFNASYAEARLLLVKVSATAISVVSCNASENINVTDQADWSTFIPIVVRLDKNSTDVNSLDYTLSIDEPTSVKENNAAKLSIYPNPAADFIKVSVNNGSDFNLSICDLTGKIITTQKVTDLNSKIDVKSLTNGIYFLQLAKDNQIIKTEKIVISH